MTRVAVIGAGVAGLVSAIELAAQGMQVTVLERAATPGGKLRSVKLGDCLLDAGPTVFTLKGIFEEVFAVAGSTLGEHLELEPLSMLARHAWDSDSCFDLYADAERTEAAKTANWWRAGAGLDVKVGSGWTAQIGVDYMFNTAGVSGGNAEGWYARGGVVYQLPLLRKNLSAPRLRQG